MNTFEAQGLAATSSSRLSMERSSKARISVKRNSARPNLRELAESSRENGRARCATIAGGLSPQAAARVTRPPAAGGVSLRHRPTNGRRDRAPMRRDRLDGERGSSYGSRPVSRSWSSSWSRPWSRSSYRPSGQRYRWGQPGLSSRWYRSGQYPGRYWRFGQGQSFPGATPRLGRHGAGTWGRWRRRYPYGTTATDRLTRSLHYDEPVEPPYEEPPMPPPVIVAAPPPPPMAEPPASDADRRKARRQRRPGTIRRVLHRAGGVRVRYGIARLRRRIVRKRLRRV